MCTYKHVYTNIVRRVISH